MAFFASAIDTLKILVIALGAGLGAWGVVNLLEGYGNDNPGANTYVSESGTNSQYLNLLPAEARRGITLTAIYGWKPGAALPVSGINEDDYKMATQIITLKY